MKYHILGITGMMTAPIALELQKNSNTVTGSDQDKIYPPFSTLLSDAKISINSTFPLADLYIIGSAYQNNPRTINEFEQIKSQNLPYISATQFLADNLIKSDSILVAGSYGKTTITALLSWIFNSLGLNPNYFFGGQAINDIPSLQKTVSNWSIIEADEAINGLDTQAKFLYYPVKYLILTSAQWEHKDGYKTAADNFNAFKKLVEKLPTDGILVYNPKDTEITKLLPFCQAQKIPYQNFDFSTQLLGLYNHENICAALTLCQELKLDINKIKLIIKDFKGLKRRLEILHQNPLIIDDFAQSPDRVKSAITAISETYPNRPIKIFFEPHASFLSYKNSLIGFSSSFKSVQEVIVTKIKFNPNISKTDRTTFADYSKELGNKVKYLPLLADVQQYFQQSLKSNDILIHFSSGGLEGLNTLNQIVYTFN
jgi:UDP-N-acetylmuramate: L-alanyl-gamma-D-glutamyl-meso-diaminopimelate ligase